MAKKRKPLRKAPHKESAAVFSSPFHDLKKMLAARGAERPAETAKPDKTPAQVVRQTVRDASALTLMDQEDASNSATARAADEAVLREALAGVRPIGGMKPARIPLEPSVNRNVVSEDAEVIAQLSDLVSGHAPFDITETEEYVEGARAGLDPRLITQLRHGEFAVQDHIDLHGMIQSAAKEALSEFVQRSVHKGFRTVLVVHGRGLGSPGGRPVLKHAAASWLSHGTIGQHVLAFTTARPPDGGGGAMYVLLRRERRRAVFDVLHGAKRRE